MRVHPVAKCIVLIAAASLSASCETTKAVGNNINRVVNGGSVDQSQLKDAIAHDSDLMETQLTQLKTKMAAALAVLRSNVEKRWGQRDTKTADRTTYVKYTQGYKSRVVTDFNQGMLTVETVDQADPQGSLKTAIVAALLTSNDPGAVDLFSDKDVSIEANRRPYLYGLVHDEQGKSIATRAQAEKFAQYLIAKKLQTRTVTGEQGAQKARFVMVAMVKDFEDKGAQRYRASIQKYSTKYNVSPTLVLAIMRTESNFNPFAVSSAPAYGLMQLVPPSGGREAYKRVEGIDQTPTAEYLYDPEHSIELGTALLGELNSSEFKAIANQDARDLCVIAAYNTGARNVTKTFDKDPKAAFADINTLDAQALYERLRTGLPYPETRQYVVKVTGYRKQFGSIVAPRTALQ
jgi:membrane-bound lytic murein transglycosylase C